MRARLGLAASVEGHPFDGPHGLEHDIDRRRLPRRHTDARDASCSVAAIDRHDIVRARLQRPENANVPVASVVVRSRADICAFRGCMCR